MQKLVSIFQCILGIASIIIFVTMKKLNRNLSSPTIKAELLGWKLDIAYSLGMSFAFFLSLYLEKTPLAFLAPYFDQIIAVIIMALILPESIYFYFRQIRSSLKKSKGFAIRLWNSTDLFLFSTILQKQAGIYG